MSDRTEFTLPTPPAGWQEASSVRAHLLMLFHPQEAAFVDGVGRLLWDLAHEASARRNPWPRGESALASELRAAGRELRWLAGFLVTMVRSAATDTIIHPDHRLAHLALEIAPQVEALAARIEAAVGPPPDVEPRPPFSRSEEVPGDV